MTDVFVPLKVTDWGKPTRATRLKAEARRFLEAIIHAGEEPEFIRDRGWRARCLTSWFYQIVAINWELLMKDGKAPRKNAQPTGWQGYVECRLTTEQIDGLMEWELADEDIWTALIAEVLGGHKFSLSFNPQNETFVAALTANAPSPNSGYTLSSFAPDHNTAIRALAYKHLVVLECDWSRAKSQRLGGIG